MSREVLGGRRFVAAGRSRRLIGLWLVLGIAVAAVALLGSPRASAQGDIAGTWSCCGAGGAGAQDWSITSASGSLGGLAEEPGGAVFATISGSVSGNAVTIVTTYTGANLGYVATFLGTLSADGNTMSGSWTSNENQAGTWTATRTSGGAPPPPVLGKSVDVKPVSGVVLVKLPAGANSAGAFDAALPELTKGQGFAPLMVATQLPVGSQVDARAGVLQLTAATSSRRQTQIVTLSGALFSLGQKRTGGEKGLTTFSLLEGAFRGAPSYSSCSVRGAAAGVGPGARAARLSPKVLQTLRASEKSGRFSTRGRYSAATVRGTAWDTVDRCDGTLTVVKRGTVLVSDFRRRTTITVRAGHSYLAKAP